MSGQTNLIVFHYESLYLWTSREQAVSIYLDIRKAFNTVTKSILAEKLGGYEPDHRMVWVEKDFKDHLGPTPCHEQGLPLTRSDCSGSH